MRPFHQFRISFKLLPDVPCFIFINGQRGEKTVQAGKQDLGQVKMDPARFSRLVRFVRAGVKAVSRTLVQNQTTGPRPLEKDDLGLLPVGLKWCSFVV